MLRLTRAGRALLAGGGCTVADATSAAVDAGATERLADRLGTDHPRRTAARVVAWGAVEAAAQAVDGLTRHYWPLTAMACAFSARARRLVAAVSVGLLDWYRHRNRDDRVRPGPVGHLVAHRLDDLAYGAGWGAWFTARSPLSVRPGPGLPLPRPGIPASTAERGRR